MPDRLRYRGDITAVADRTRMYGPDVGARYLKIGDLTYDPKTDVTTATMRPIMPPEFRERLEPLVAMQTERERIRALFNG